MSAEKTPYLSPEEYLALERAAETRSEYYDGQMFAMSGGTEDHNMIAGNLFAALHPLLRGTGCRVYMENMRVKVQANGLYTYSDVVAACGEIRFTDKRRDTLINPRMITEVLSESTESYVRGAKFELYRGLESLREYVLIAQNHCLIELFTRQPDGDSWLYRTFSDLNGSLPLESIGCEVPVSEIYYDLALPDPAPTPAPPDPNP